jgi:hypothetical protein
MQDSSYYEDYVKEVKPYHTQIRNFITKYTITEINQESATPAPTPSIVYFKVTDGVGRNDFVIKLTDPVKIQNARDQLNNVVPKLHITGLIIKSTVDYNPNYSYHYDPDTIDFFEYAMEVCDATFDYTEEYLDEAGGAFLPGLRLCPWGSLLVEEVSLTPTTTYLLGQLRRGTLGTGTPPLHRAGTYVQEIGPSETVPYTEASIVQQVVSDGTNILPLTFIPGKSSDVWEYSTGFTSSIPVGYGQSNDIEVFVGGYDTTAVWASGVDYIIGTVVNVGSYTYRCIAEHTSSTVFNNDSDNWQFFIGNIRLKKKPYAVHNVNQAANSPEGDIQIEADFAVDGESKELRLTNKLAFGTKVTVVKRTGIAWDNETNILASDTKIARFLKGSPGVWYTNIKFND